MDHPLLRDLGLERAVNYTVEFMRKLGIPNSFVDRVADIEIKDYRGLLPCDFLNEISVRDNCEAYRSTTDTFYLKHTNCTDASYKIQGRYIISSKENTPIQISYKAFRLDKDGFPMIPDDESLKEALELYIKKKQFTKLFDQQKISQQVLQQTQQDYAWAVGQASASLVRVSPDEMESIANVWSMLLLRNNEHKNNYATLGTREYIKQH